MSSINPNIRASILTSTPSAKPKTEVEKKTLNEAASGSTAEAASGERPSASLLQTLAGVKPKKQFDIAALDKQIAGGAVHSSTLAGLQEFAAIG